MDRGGWDKNPRRSSAQALANHIRERPTGATALFIIPITNPCIAENMIFLCDIMTAKI